MKSTGDNPCSSFSHQLGPPLPESLPDPSTHPSPACLRAWWDTNCECPLCFMSPFQAVSSRACSAGLNLVSLSPSRSCPWSPSVMGAPRRPPGPENPRVGPRACGAGACLQHTPVLRGRLSRRVTRRHLANLLWFPIKSFVRVA